MTARWLLNEIMDEMGEVNCGRLADCFKMMNNLQNRAEGVPGMGLVYGEPGLGKTQTINWWAFKNNAILVRCSFNEPI